MPIRRLALASLAVVAAVGLFPAQAVAAPAGVRLSVTTNCPPTGGLEVTLTIRNETSAERRLAGDLHLTLDAVRRRGLEHVGAVFAFPAFGFNIIPAHGERTFVLPFGTEVPEAEEPGIDMSAHRLLLTVEAVIAGRDQAIDRLFSLAGCPPLA